MTLHFAGLDCEMSGTLVVQHKLIQLGIALSDTLVFSSRIGWEDCAYDEDALQVIGLRPEDLREGPPVDEVDRAAADWLRRQGVTEDSLVAVGWGVTGFDLPFVITTLPEVTSFLHHHSIELNAICHTLEGSKPYAGRLPSAIEWKKMAREAAAIHLFLSHDLEARWHDAGYDAMTSLLSWRWLQQVIADPCPGARPLPSEELR
jgi:hypothetical protein